MIRIHVVAQTAFVFDLSDVRALRTLGITGVLVGTLPRAPQQNVFLGLPLQLSVYEACWLVANGHAHFVDGVLYNESAARCLESPTDHTNHVYAVTPDIFLPQDKTRGERADKNDDGPQGHTQGEDAQQGKKLIELGSVHVSGDVNSFEAGHEVKEASPSEHEDGEESNEIEGSNEVEESNEDGEQSNEHKQESNEDKEENIEIEGESNEDGEENYEIEESNENEEQSNDVEGESIESRKNNSQLTSSVGDLEPKLRKMHLELEDIGSQNASGLSVNLETEIEAYTLSLSQYLARQTLPEAFEAKYSAFARLRSLQYYMMPGLRFGGVFVAYPGDPLQFHSHLIVKVLQKNENVDLLELVTSGRLATAVKKAWVLMGEGTEENPDHIPEKQPTHPLTPTPMRAFSIEWAGFG